jgi:hypothetical protein
LLLVWPKIGDRLRTYKGRSVWSKFQRDGAQNTMMANWVGEYTRDAANYPTPHKALLAAAVICLPVAIILNRSRNFAFFFLGLALLILLSVSLWDYKAQLDMSRDGTAELIITAVLCFPLLPPTNIYFLIRPFFLYLAYRKI